MKRLNTIPKKIVSMSIIVMLIISPGIALSQQRVSVTAKIANLRSGAGTNNDVLWQVEKYHPFLVIEDKGKWYKVRDFENDQAWIHKSLVGKTKSIITIKDKVNFRSKPTTKSSKVFTAERGVPFKVLGQKGDWYRVEHADGDRGWIYKPLVW